MQGKLRGRQLPFAAVCQFPVAEGGGRTEQLYPAQPKEGVVYEREYTEGQT